MLHAVCQVLLDSSDAAEVTLTTANRTHDAVKRISWPDHHIEEKGGILASLSFAAWNSSRKSERYAEMVNLERQCEADVASQQIGRAFLDLPCDERSMMLNTRFLSDPAFLLSRMVRLIRLGDSRPDVCAAGARELYRWLTLSGSIRPGEEIAWFACRAATTLAGALRHLGQKKDAARWLDTARTHLAKASGRATLRCQIEYSRLALLYDSRDWDQTLEGVPPLLEELEALQLETDVAKVKFLRACVQKEQGSSLALESFEDLLSNQTIRRDELLHGLSLMHVGEILGQRGDYLAAMPILEQALPFLEASGVLWAVADLHAVAAEILRNQGFVPAAINAYRSAIGDYGEQGLSVRVAYIRVVLAESLIADGREAEALSELLAALPVIERESLAKEAVAAVVLLHEALKRSKADTEALHVLREQLDRMRSGGEL